MQHFKAPFSWRQCSSYYMHGVSEQLSLKFAGSLRVLCCLKQLLQSAPGS